ncbi:hypothetical protein OESDEN_03053 [Oesophagostomum dentatum]|uniref:SGNH domain-containing protein n=1 Tax=Oesophagostomum dentatum TaxID=61180 RepID=A0A0B1THD9_OESDE|nr:hypothetical protein OESDEN_03053 [Oesophagostomum dentatum]
MQWYLLVPFIYFIQRLFTNDERPFFSGVAVISLILYFCLDIDAAFYSVFARMWQFCCGIVAFAWSQNENFYPERSTADESQLLNNEQNITRKGMPEFSWMMEFFTCAVFMLAMAVPFLMNPLPTRFLRIETTFATAILIYLGKKHQTILLTKSELVYVGDISYAFYLFHWPVHVIVTYYYFENPLGPLFGIFVSGFLAAITYRYYEETYLRMSPPIVISLILGLLCGCAFLSFQPERADDLSLELNIDLSKVNVNDAAWNMTLMRYLIAKEGHSHMYNEECTYSDRFLNKTAKPRGFCSMQKGSGKYNFLVLGNSFACNQGDVVYKAFKVHANEFNIFCLSACEVWLPTRSECDSIVNYTAILEELKPDVVFFIIRHVKGKEAFNGTNMLSDDVIYRNQTRFLDYLEKVAKKVYIIQAVPSCKTQCPYIALKYTEKGKPLNAIKDGLIVRDDFFARQRIWEMGIRCRKCEIVDYMPALVDEHGEYLGYDPKTNLMYMDVDNHFNNFGKARIRTVFDRLSKNFMM